MASRTTTILLAVGVVALLGVGGVVVNGVIETTRALAGGGGKAREPKSEAKAEVEPEREEPAQPPLPEPEPRRREVDPNAHLAPDLQASLQPRPAPDALSNALEGDGAARSIAERAEDRGLTPHELRERIAARQGLSFEQYQRRRDARSDWRAEQDVDDLHARKAARDQKHQELSLEELAALEQAKAARKEIAEQDPSIKEAAQVLKQLQEVGKEP